MLITFVIPLAAGFLMAHGWMKRDYAVLVAGVVIFAACMLNI
jgi:hypothetical protein